MRPTSILIAALMALMAAPYAQAKKNPADYPLRVSLASVNNHSHYNNQVFNYADGEGRGNLFENSQPKAFDFSFNCLMRPVGSMGFETYMARWKKPGRVLEVLLPAMGHPDNLESCELQVMVKEGIAYYRPHGMLAEESADAYKQWMVRNNYDPEHGKNLPTQPEQPGGGASTQRPADPPPTEPPSDRQ